MATSTTIHTDRADKNKVSIAELEDLRVIPVIFIPGVMGTNLMDLQGKPVWRFDGPATLATWSLPGSGPKERKNILHPDKVNIDDRGVIPMSVDIQARLDRVIAQEYPKNIADKDQVARFAAAMREAAEGDQPETSLFGARQQRGWGEVANASYGSFLDELQNALYRDKPSSENKTLHHLYQKLLNTPLGLEYGPDSLESADLEVMKLYHFPVHAIGYNWLGSNKISADRVDKQITRIISNYNEKKIKCSKVILVTHSMGGLVARYYSECLAKPGRSRVYGIVHGVMPSTGAAAAYTRMKRGTENTVSNIEGFVTSHILGRNAAEMVAICSQASGPLELLPTDKYNPNWIEIKDRHGDVNCFPEGKPYQIYLERTKWWRLMEENLLNPLNTTLDKKQIDTDWNMYEKLITDNVMPLHKALKDTYHPITYSFYGKHKGSEIPPSYRTQETVVWSGALASGRTSFYSALPKLDDGRLNLNEINAVRTVKDELSTAEQSWEMRDNDSNIYAYIGQRFTLRDASENGDGTVPLCAGILPDKKVKERLAVEVCHEPAYRDKLSLAFTLRSVIKIAQQVNYDKEMAYI